MASEALLLSLLLASSQKVIHLIPCKCLNSKAHDRFGYSLEKGNIQGGQEAIKAHVQFWCIDELTEWFHFKDVLRELIRKALQLSSTQNWT